MDKKIESLVEFFSSAGSAEERYRRIIDLGKGLDCPPFESFDDGMLVNGCQSRMYLRSELTNGKIFFHIYSDALISKGLAALLVLVYNGEDAETLVKSVPSFIQSLGIYESLTPGRSNGLASIFLRMKQEALKTLVSKS